MRHLAIGFGVFILLVVLLADTANLGLVRSVYAFPYGDKLGHFVLYGVLTLLAGLAAVELMPQVEPRRLLLRVSLVIAALIAAEELSQAWLPSRAADPFDLLASLAGVAVFAYAAYRLAQQRRAAARTQ